MAKLKYWVWLSGIGNVQPFTKYRLIQEMGDPETIFFSGRDELMFAGARPGEAEKLMDKSLYAAEHSLEICEERGITVLTLQDAGYPERLRNIPDPPVVLYIQGRLPPVDESALIAVVGTRHPTPYGMKMAIKMGEEITRGGGVVVSGLAEGCDGMAMDAALRAGGVSVGVLGTAINKIYPAKNRRLFSEVRVRGALVSEYGPDMRTYPASFKDRNRIISGLSLGVVVVEAPIRSGTRVTVDHALDQGRDVFAVPGNVDIAAAEGCNDLIAHGAIVVSAGEDVLAEYYTRNDLFRQKITPTLIKKEIDKPKDIVYIDKTEGRPAPVKTEGVDKLPEAQRRILEAMTRPDMHADEIIEAVGLTAAEVLAALTMLQVAGYVSQGAGRRYTRK